MAIKLSTFLYVTIFCINMIIPLQAYYQAVIKSPVIEMSSTFSPLSKNMPVYPGNRCHQALFNEIFNVLDEKNNFVKISSKKVKYNDSFNESDNSFWTDKNNIQQISKLKKEVRATIPHPNYASEQTIVLINPWKNFSVGTRFKHLKNNDTEDKYAIVYPNYTQNSIIVDYVPCTCAIAEIKQSEKEMRHLFIKTIDELINRIKIDNSDHVIPYVWGGNSFVAPYKESEKYQEDGKWYRAGNNKPYTGYDCSGLIMRMAQIAGFDFPWKTSSVIAKTQKELPKDSILENGDIIWIPGHVMIISNIQNNELIEARGYVSGHGYVHKTRLDQAFENITTYDDLLATYYTQKPIRLKDRYGQFYLETNFKILKLMS